jgi:hypothetical protein
MTRISLDLPDDIARRLEAAWPDMPRRTLEAVVDEGYRDGALTRDQVGRLLGLSSGKTETFLKASRAYLRYGEVDLEDDRRDLDGVSPR